MIEIGMKVRVVSGPEYEGRFLGCFGYVEKRFFGADRIMPKYGVRICGFENKSSKDGLFWFDSDNLQIDCGAEQGSSFSTTAYYSDSLSIDASTGAFIHCHPVPQEKRDLIDRVMFQPPATIIFWTDGTKTVVKTQNGDEFDPEKGMAMAIAKKFFGNKPSYFNRFKKHITKEWIKKEEEEV